MINVAVIIITYRRPQGLIRVLEGLGQQKCSDPSRSFQVSAIVVDNDSKKSAKASVELFQLSSQLDVQYISEPAQGIPLARNKGLAVVPANAEFLCFIDDDEWPGETWIDELLKTQRATGADCVLGAVIPVYPDSAPRWLVRSRVFDSWQFADQEQLNEAASNNVLISHAFIRKTKLRFEERMRMTGGSDFLFFQQAVALGMRIVWSAAAPVYEEVPMSRMKLRWLVQRQFRLGNTFSVSERLVGTKLGLAKLVAVGFIRMLVGFAMLPAILFSPYYGMRALMHVLRGAGTVAGAFGHAHQEYSPKGVALDRSGQTSTLN
jgi:glycosyltransferase involved in cell wall biosynthesis